MYRMAEKANREWLDNQPCSSRAGAQSSQAWRVEERS